MQRQKRSDNRGNPNTKLVGGVAYQPTFLLDAVLLTDNLIQPMYLKDTVSRCEHVTVSVFTFWTFGPFGRTLDSNFTSHCIALLAV